MSALLCGQQTASVLTTTKSFCTAQILDVVLKETQILFLWLNSCFNALCMCEYIINTSTSFTLKSCNSDIIQLLSFKLQVSVSLLKCIAAQVLSLVGFLGH